MILTLTNYEVYDILACIDIYLIDLENDILAKRLTDLRFKLSSRLDEGGTQ